MDELNLPRSAPQNLNKLASLLRGEVRVALDIDETLSATALAWAQQLASKFGPPLSLSIEEAVRRHGIVQNIPGWEEDKVTSEVRRFLNLNPDSFFDLQPVAGVPALLNHLPKHWQLAGYLTARTEIHRAPTQRWLAHHGFPDLPMIVRPADCPPEKRHEWKASVIAERNSPFNVLIDDQISILETLPAEAEVAVLIVNGGTENTPQRGSTKFGNDRWLVAHDWEELIESIEVVLDAN